jgi:hypothetical protein
MDVITSIFDEFLVCTVKLAVSNIRRLNIANHSLILRLMSLEVAPPTAKTGPDAVQNNSGNVSSTQGVSSTMSSPVEMTAGLTNPSLSISLPSDSNISLRASFASPTAPLQATMDSSGPSLLPPPSQASPYVNASSSAAVRPLSMSRRELLHASRVIFYMREHPASLAAMSAHAAPEERVELAHVLIARVYSMWSTDDEQLKHLLSAVLADENRRLQSPFGTHQHHLQQHSPRFINQLNMTLQRHGGQHVPTFSSLLLSQLLHRIDVVLAVRTLCESLDSSSIAVAVEAMSRQQQQTSFAMNFSSSQNSTASSTKSTGSGNDVSELCRRIVEPFCTKLMEFVNRNGFPRAVACAVSALSGQSSTNNPAASNSRGMISHMDAGVAMSPSDLICNCIRKFMFAD